MLIYSSLFTYFRLLFRTRLYIILLFLRESHSARHTKSFKISGCYFLKCGAIQYDQTYFKLVRDILRIGRTYRDQNQPSNSLTFAKVALLDSTFLRFNIDDPELADECIAAVYSLIHQIGGVLAEAEAEGRIDVDQIENKLKEFIKRD